MPFSPSQTTWLALGLACGPLAGNGFARFAYGLVLPAMQQDLGLSYAAAGGLNTANALGYLTGAVMTSLALRRFDPSQLFRYGLLLTALSVLAMALTRDYGLLSGLRFLGGVGAAPTFISGAALAARLGQDAPSRAGLLIAIYFAGIGAGLFLSGVFIPPYLAALGEGAWPAAWGWMGVASALALIPAWIAARQIPSAPTGKADQVWPWRFFTFAFLSYGLYAVGYVIYITFLAAWMRQAADGVANIMIVWGVMGLAVVAAPFVWRPLLARWSGRSVFALSVIITGVGSGAALLPGGLGILILSALLYGLAFIITPSAIGAMVRENLAPPQWGAAMAAFTILFAGLQTVGPIISGALADWTGSLAQGLGLGTILLFAGGAVGFLQPARLPR